MRRSRKQQEVSARSTTLGHSNTSLAILALALLLAACGGGDAGDPPETTEQATNTTAAASDSAVTETTSDPGATQTTASPAVAADGTCRVVEDALIEVDVVSPATDVADVYVDVEIGKASGDRDVVTVRLTSMLPGEHAIHPFEIIGAVESECVVTTIDAPAYFDERNALDLADVTLCEVIDDNGGMAVTTTVNNSGTDEATYVMVAGLYDADGIRRYSMDASNKDTAPGEATIGKPRRLGVDYVDGLTCTVNSVIRRPGR